jgi:UDP-N-acetylglucosamine 2-epimerase
MSALLDNPGSYSRMSRIGNPYGDGRASCRIAEWFMTSEAETTPPTVGLVSQERRSRLP